MYSFKGDWLSPESPGEAKRVRARAHVSLNIVAVCICWSIAQSQISSSNVFIQFDLLALYLLLLPHSPISRFRLKYVNQKSNQNVEEKKNVPFFLANSIKNSR